MRDLQRFLVTGGAGFIGSAFVSYLLREVTTCAKVVNVDLLTYAANLKNLEAISEDPRYLFIKADICQEERIEELCKEHQIEAIVHFAAETHVDRSISMPKIFFEANVKGTLHLLEVLRKLPHIHLHHVSTDEVYGSLGNEGHFDENSPYRPNSPYAASKAASDHFVRAYAHTYGLSTTLSHCTNNYGPRQHLEKFIPCMIQSCIEMKPFPIYGKGLNVRDWLFVEDHIEALWAILKKGKKGEVYDIGGGWEMKNLDVLDLIIEEFAKIQGEDPKKYHPLITFVPDRLGHDLRYAISSKKLKNELGWKPRHDFRLGIHKTIQWYLEHSKSFYVSV